MKDLSIKSPVRLANEDDEPALWVLCKEMHAEQPYHPLSWDKVFPMIRLATQRSRGIIGCIGPKDDIKGAIFMLIEPIWYSEDFHLLEVFNYVRPDSRRSTYAKDMILYAIECSEQLGIDLTIGVFSSIRTEAKVRLYSRLLPKRGEFFSHSPKNRAFAPNAHAVAAE